jgi:iron(III) transport system substrate-binding protein
MYLHCGICSAEFLFQKEKRMKGRIAILIVIAMLFCSVTVFAGARPERATKVVAYSAHEDTIINNMARLWQQDYPNIQLEVIKMGSGDVISRVRAESSNPQADVIWSIGGEALEQNNDLLHAYTPKDWNMIEDVYKVGTNWLPYTGIMNVFLVNTNMLTPAQYPRTWKDLASSHIEGVSTARADQSGSSYMQLANVLAIYGDGEEGWKVYRSIMENFVIASSSGAVSRVTNDGEVPVAITLEDNAQRFVLGGGPVAIVYPEDGAIAAPDGIAIVKNAPNLDGAKLFIDWAMSSKVQNFLVQEMGRRPVRKDASTPPGLPPMSQINTIEYDFGWSAANRNDFIARFRQLMMDLNL